MLEDDAFALSPINFFQLKIDGHLVTKTVNEKKYLLPDTSKICFEEHFAKVYFGWTKESLEFVIDSKVSFQKVNYPEFRKGDSVEVMIDTRDVKTSGFNTRFCHHFFFLPEAIDGVVAGEVTRFRTEDRHEYCDAKELIVKTTAGSRGYTMKISIPASCLVGYEPDQFDRLGLTYRINRTNDEPQHFSVVSGEYQIEQQPSLWSSVKLIN